jgi:ERCC4-type nuclease
MASKAATRRVKGVSDVYLIVDTRERNVIPFLEDALQEYAHVVAQVNTGDYLICRKGAPGQPPTILAVIERKTYADFAASFKDGRYENLDKMLAMRARTGCQLFFFVEGPAFPSPGRRFARIPYENILAAMTKLPVQHGVFVVLTEDESHTAKRLTDHLRCFDAVPVPHGTVPGPRPPNARPAAGPNIAINIAGEGGATNIVIDAASDGDEEGAGGDDTQGLVVPDAILGLVAESDSAAATNAWARLRGISVVLGKILTREFTVAELAGQHVTLAQIGALKTATGRAINKDAASSLLAVRAGSLEHATKVVSGLRGVTPAVATTILQAVGGLARLCNAPLTTVEAVPLQQKSRTVRLGKARAERIRRILHFKEPQTVAGALVEAKVDLAVESGVKVTAPPKSGGRVRLLPAGETAPVVSACARSRLLTTPPAAPPACVAAVAPADTIVLTDADFDELFC